MSARYAAYKLIEKVETGGYSNIALGGMFSNQTPFPTGIRRLRQGCFTVLPSGSLRWSTL